MSNSGCGGGPFLLFGFPCVSTDVDEALASPCRSRDTERESLEFLGDADEGTLSEGSTSFFCFEAGRISSRSTGTPRETRKRRRVLERIQSGGASGGGATSCDQSEAERGVVKDVLSLGSGGNCGTSSSSAGKRLARCGSVVDMMSSYVNPSKSGIAFRHGVVSGSSPQEELRLMD